MPKQIEFNGLRDSGFHAGPKKSWIVYEIAWSWSQLKHFWDLFDRETCQSDYFYGVVDLFGPNSILSIGGISGQLIQPENPLDLKYPGGQTMEASWQYLWKPCDLAKQLINVDINVYKNNPSRFFDFATAIFKSGVAMKLTDYGNESVEVTQIPLRRLPGMVKTDLRWQLSAAS